MNADEKRTAPVILIIDDEVAILRFLRAALDTGEFSVHEAQTGYTGIAAASAKRPDVILLDLGLPDLDGVEVIKRIREWSEVPIIVLSVREAESEKVAALDAGADDYLTKPFGVAELQARIRVSLRRSQQQAPEAVYRSDDLEVDVSRRRVTVSGEEVQLTPTEYELLRLLVNHAGNVVTHTQILRKIWGAAYGEQQNILRVNISHLRQKIEKNPSRPRLIITEPGVGYRLKGE
ncbi:response regulator [Geomonas sp. RF6]|uniref:response regulator n=1 Tax=Geomonas sp. RF6 TaxID=2897342 RepID=UPI001E32BF72|nr:response regulator [Geomonas sp. RF6]UFS72255.1 response regulator [Geomonas sp. RF6]